MEEELVCDCRKADFLNFGAYLRCQHCYTEFRWVGEGPSRRMEKRKVQPDGSYPFKWEELVRK